MRGRHCGTSPGASLCPVTSLGKLRLLFDLAQCQVVNAESQWCHYTSLNTTMVHSFLFSVSFLGSGVSFPAFEASQPHSEKSILFRWLTVTRCLARLSPQPLGLQVAATWMSSSVGWTACASPCAGAATETRTAWT